MHKFKFTTPTAQDGLKETLRGLHEDNRDFVTQNKTEILSAYENYIGNLKPCGLEAIYELWPKIDAITGQEIQGNIEKRNHANGLYETKKALRRNHWDTLIKENGNQQLICPFCGLACCKDMDHYAPRELFPELSVFRPNLIPLCHDCNEKKNSLWMDNHKRLFFNAFYDDLPEMQLFTCQITIVNDMPTAKIGVHPDIKSSAILKVIDSTIEKLQLVTRLQEECNNLFKKEILRIIQEYRKTNWPVEEDYWVYRMENYEAYCEDISTWNQLERIIYCSMRDSSELKQWVMTQIKQ